MEKRSKRELIQLIESQENKIRRYENKLGDLIAAYKGLSKEKEALESSFKALSAQKSNSNVVNEASNKSPPPEGGEDMISNDVQNQLATLTSTITTLTQEKSRIEANYLSEKKTLLAQKNEIAQKLEAEQQKFKEQRQMYETQLQELKARIWKQQQEREAEDQNHAIMIRELQQLLASERSAKETLESKLKQMSMNQTDEDKRNEEYVRRIKELTSELRDVQSRLKQAEDKANQPSPFLLQLQHEMENIKVSHMVAVEEEHRRANEAEEKLKALSISSEQRVASLEARLSELSEMVGNYDSLRQHDKEAIQKLKEQVSKLDSENKALSKTLSENKLTLEDEVHDSNLDSQALVTKIRGLTKLLVAANERSEHPMNISNLFLGCFEELTEEKLHAKCKDELLQLKDEFERYKSWIQTTVKAKTFQQIQSPSQNELQDTVTELKQHVAELKEKLASCREQLESSRVAQKSITEHSQEKLRELQSEHKQEIASLAASYKARLSELEDQAQRHRDRTIQLLREKDAEIEMYKASLRGFKHSEKTKESTTEHSSQVEKGKSDPIHMIDSLPNAFNHASAVNSARIIYYAEEMARKDQELSTLRKSRLQAETALHELQRKLVEREEHYAEKLQELESQLRRFKELNKSTLDATTSMEYLKNVVLQYMLCGEHGSKKHMLNAIATVLHFSPSEIRQVYQFNQWGSWSSTSLSRSSSSISSTISEM